METELLLARIDERQKALDDKFEIHQQILTDKLDIILKQTIKLNDRITSLEEAKNKVYGAIAIVSFLITIVEVFLHK